MLQAKDFILMRKFAVFFLLVTCSVTTVSARIGESKEEITKRYGSGVKTGDRLRSPGVETMKYNKGGMTIEVIFLQQRSIWEIYKRDDKNITNDDIKLLLDIYDTPRNNWRFDKQDSRWVRTGKPRLIGYKWPSHEDYFCIKNEEACEMAEKAGKIDPTGL